MAVSFSSKDVDRKAVAVRTAIATARESLKDPKFVQQLGARRTDFESRLNRLEAALAEYEAAMGAARPENDGTVAAVGVATVSAGGASLNPYVIIGGLLILSFASSVGLAEMTRAMKASRRLDTESIGLRDLLQTLTRPVSPPVPSPVSPEVMTKLLDTMVQRAMEAAAIATTAAAAESWIELQRYLGTTILAVAGTKAAVVAIHHRVMEIVGRFPPQPKCLDLLDDYMDAWHWATRNPMKGWNRFLKAALALIKCIGRDRPGPGGLTAGIL
ncbi:hypothetical protein Pan44_40990 [Caulifigura coniformis]|uniref:Uncharacterized protein n=1 Tax=Caulifigura coniformis TaxID=2527983 RepID=A0A517SIX0_9PLAN|nr:hypothetical protein [Caulifigura coniformis]QDT56049.1 hypothetical protein Pan44_40990 [Caulifigura coniformis]